MFRTGPFILATLMAASAWGQSVISAHSGVIQYVEGQVTLDGQAVAPKFAEFPDVKPDQTLATEDGRAEVLLTPGVFLRLAENSSFRMVSNKLSDTRVEVLSGSAILEVGELLQNNAIVVQFHGADIALLKKGLYRMDSTDPSSLRVYDGEARVTAGSETLTAGRGHEMIFGAVVQARGFDTKQTDAFFRWSARRDEYVAQANLTSAKSTADSSYNYAGSGGVAGSWAWNPWYGMYTYLPGAGMYMSPFGSMFYSPATIGYFYGGALGYYGGYGSPYSYAAPVSNRPATSLASGPRASTALAQAGSAGGGVSSLGARTSASRAAGRR